jgi:hypothetical protein
MAGAAAGGGVRGVSLIIAGVTTQVERVRGSGFKVQGSGERRSCPNPIAACPNPLYGRIAKTMVSALVDFLNLEP